MRTASTIVVAFVLASVGVGQARSSQPPARRTLTACELLLPAEMAGILKVGAMEKDEVNSGLNEMTRVDHCNWGVKGATTGDGVGISVYRSQSQGDGAGLAEYGAAKGAAPEHDSCRAVEPLGGVGDEAVYSPAPVGAWGSVAFRKRAVAVMITGSASKDALIAMAKIAAGRL
jgi:hypothetical protein